MCTIMCAPALSVCNCLVLICELCLHKCAQPLSGALCCSLCQDTVLEELVSLVVTEPNSEVEYQVRFKHASLAAELLSAEVPSIVDKLGSSEELLTVLCK